MLRRCFSFERLWFYPFTSTFLIGKVVSSKWRNLGPNLCHQKSPDLLGWRLQIAHQHVTGMHRFAINLVARKISSDKRIFWRFAVKDLWAFHRVASSSGMAMQYRSCVSLQWNWLTWWNWKIHDVPEGNMEFLIRLTGATTWKILLLCWMNSK